jgi:hypothetical protein
MGNNRVIRQAYIDHTQPSRMAVTLLMPYQSIRYNNSPAISTVSGFNFLSIYARV